MRTWSIILVVLIFTTLAGVGYYFFSFKTDSSDTSPTKYQDDETGITFNYPVGYKTVGDMISKDNDQVYIKSIQFIPKEGEPKTLPMQITIFAKESDQEKYQTKVSEVKQYYSDNSSRVGTINIHGSEVPLYHAEKKSEKIYIIGFYFEDSDFLFLVERYHTSSEEDKVADVIAEKIISTFSY
jgi:hypothetical protein